MKPTPPRFSVMSGTIMEVDPVGRTLTVQGLIMNKTFDVPEDVTISTNEQAQADLSSLHTGQLVDITYEQHPNGSIAHRIEPTSQQFHQAA